jgi:hypothetical protein
MSQVQSEYLYVVLTTGLQKLRNVQCFVHAVNFVN